jgi:hypothetical protein
MGKPQAWSHSKLECHDNCNWQFHEKYVAKNLPPEEKSDQQLWGIHVHQQFEWHGSRVDYQLPFDLTVHEPFLARLNVEGETADVDRVEMKVALNTKFQPCAYFDDKKNLSTPRVWWRGVIDRHLVWKSEGRCKIVDYKTGKKKDDWTQLAETAVYLFVLYPEVNLINAQFYWTEDQTFTKKVWARSEIDTLVAMYAPKLAAYAYSFKNDAWPKKQSGLCKGWCPVTSCMFWEAKKEKKW